MNLECGHDEEVGLVCAACAVEVMRDFTKLEEELERAGDRLALVRRFAGVWKASGGPLNQYLAGKLLKVLDADEAQLEVLKRTKVLAAQEGGFEGEIEASTDYDPGDKVIKRRKLTLGETP